MSGGSNSVLQVFRSLHPSVGGPLAYLHALRASLGDSQLAVAALEPVPVDARVETVFQGSATTSIGRALQLGRWLNDELANFGMVHVHGVFGWHAVLALVACYVAQRPYVISTHGHLLSNALQQKAFKKRLYFYWIGRRILLRARAVVATSRLESCAILQFEPQARVQVIPPGVALPAPPSARRASGGILQILFLGRLHPHKQISVLLEALSQLRHRGREARLWLVGEGEASYEAFLHSEVARLGLVAQVQFKGYQGGQDRDAVQQQADMLVLPSLSENFSFAVAEALAQGVPVVVSDQVGLADLVAQYACGEVTPVGDVVALTGAIARLGEPQRLEHARRQARRCAEEALSLGQMQRALLGLYESVQAASVPIN